jgi:flagellum-specific ATP synthase
MEYYDLINDGKSGSGLLDGYIEAVGSTSALRLEGRVCGVTGQTIEAEGLGAPVGSLCRVFTGSGGGGGECLAQVIGFRGTRTLLMALSPSGGVGSGDRAESLSTSPRITCSDKLLGRVLNGMGEPMDGRGHLGVGRPRSTEGRALRPLERAAIDKSITTSVRAIDGLHTCGLGQRMGIFSGPGVGKSTLISQVAQHTSADVSVIALIGERGREVYDFVHHTMGPEGMRRCVLVVSTSDDPPLMRTRAAKMACTIAEHFRDEGKDVLLLIDSLTRLAHAQRQIGLAAGEPPATRGYPPSVFGLIPEILERAGRSEKGSITGFYTVLVEGDDFNEPIPDAVKGITDGHIMLTRDLANRGHFPAIDVTQSISRVRGDVAPSEQVRMARKVLSLHAVWNDIEDLYNLGAYQRGMSVEYDLAVDAHPKIVAYLKQDSKQPTTLAEAQRQLTELHQWIDLTERNLKQAAAKKGRA